MKLFFRFLLRAVIQPIIFLFYRIRRTGVEQFPKEGGVLILGNHVSYIDAFVVYLSCPRRVRFVILESYMNVKAISWFLRLYDAIPIRPKNAKEAIVRTAEALEEGSVVCLFPEGGLTRLGVTTEFKKGFELIVRKSGCQVVPFYMDGLWSSIFSFERNRYFKKRPNGVICPLQVSWGAPIAPENANVESVRCAIWEQSVEAFSMRREFQVPLEKTLIRNLKKGRRDSLFVEYGKNGERDWSRAYTLGLATAMARRWMYQREETGDRIGILLPPGPMTAVINIGLFLAGKTPVNLPFTIDQDETEAVAKAIAPLGINTVVTSRAFMPHLMDFWHGDEGVFIDLKSVISAPGSPLAMLERVRAMIEPAWLTCWRLDLNQRSIDREAVGTVASPGDKPLFFSAQTLLRSATRVVSANFVEKDDIIFSETSMAMPEGLALGCWAPIVGRGRVVSRSFALRDSFEALENAILDQGVTIVVGDGAFYGSLERALSIRSLKYGIIFGPANKWELEDWEELLDLPLARAWSHSGRVVTMSRTDPFTGDTERHIKQVGRNPKSVGRLLPGIAAKVEEGRLWLKFASCEDATADKEWIPGPDDAEIDADGFVYIRNVDLR